MIIDIVLGVIENNETTTYCLDLKLKGRKYGAKLGAIKVGTNTRIRIENESLEFIARNILSVVDNGRVENPVYKILWNGDGQERAEVIISQLQEMLYYRDALQRLYRGINQTRETSVYH